MTDKLFKFLLILLSTTTLLRNFHLCGVYYPILELSLSLLQILFNFVLLSFLDTIFIFTEPDFYKPYLGRYLPIL